MRERLPSRYRVATALLLAVTSGAVGCSSNDRPDLLTWAPRWDTAKDAAEAVVDTAPNPERSACTDLRTVADSAPDQLIPAPDAGMDESVDEWIVIAGDTAESCLANDAASIQTDALTSATDTIDEMVDGLEPQR